MKAHIPLIVLLAAFTCGTSGALQAAGDTPAPAIVRVGTVIRNGGEVIKIGTSETTVWHELGGPHRKISDNLWVYHNYKADNEVAQKHACSDLLITFEHERVSRMALVNTRATRVIAAKIKRDPAFLSRTLVAAK